MFNNRYHTDKLLLGNPDWIAILVYVLLVLVGWLNIYAAVYDESHSGILDLSQRYGMQLVWIIISATLAMTILLIDAKYYHIVAYPLYTFLLLVLLAVLFFGKEVNGAKAWIMIGRVGLQPAEFAKLTTSLALARYMSSYSFDLKNPQKLWRVGMIIGIPVLIILLQNDTGSALVYTSFLFMLYREGFNKWVYIALGMVLFLFVGSFLLQPSILLLMLILLCMMAEGLANGNWRNKVIYFAALLLFSLLLYLLWPIVFGGSLSYYWALLACTLLSLPTVLIYAYGHKLSNIQTYISLFLGSLVFTYSIDYVFDNMLQLHQQKRILDLLGLVSDPKGWGYNVNQSKIAIGSGGFSGKGFLEGTQTKFNFVPEQSTDFIFCTVGEEWGFLGSTVVVVLFGLLIFRLLKMGERQMEPFGRIYCYCVASIFLFHVLINIGMTIGIMPVIGIPLPFFSYGGSSMIAFTLLLFIAIRFDMFKNETTI